MKAKYLVKTLIAGMMLSACGPKDEQRYIIDMKADNKIAYHSVKDSNNVHVMLFKKIKGEVNFYPYIRVGDTIQGFDLGERVSTSLILTPCGYESAISTVNGKTFHILEEIAKRDSIIRSMRQAKVK